MKTVFGIDVSKSTSNVAILIDSKKFEEFKINNDLIGFKKLASTLNTFSNPEVIFEATGVYSRRLAFFLQKYGYSYVQLNPLQAKKEMDSLRKNKTDKNDAFHLAKTQFILNRHKAMIQNPVYSELMNESRFYQEQISDFVKEKNRLHRILQLTFPDIEQLFSKPTGQTYWNLVMEFPIPSLVQKYNTDQLGEIVFEAANHMIGMDKARNDGIKLLELSKRTISSVNPDSLTIEQVKFHANRLLEIDKLKKQIIKSMESLAEKLPEYKSLCSIPGISTITAVSLIAELGDIRRFNRTSQINAFVGIDLMHYESGNYEAKDIISKRGNPHARKILYRTVIDMVSVSRYQANHINDYYQKKKQSSQHGTKKIAVAAMSRLIRTIYHLVIKNETYDYSIASHARN
jgi:transposase